MPGKKNKVKFGLKNVHYAMLTLADDGTYTFGPPKAIPGAVNLSMDSNGGAEHFYADDMAYYTTNNNMGYDGDLEIALVPDSFREDALNETKDSNGVYVESSDAEMNPFALLFEFTGDKKRIRHVLYNCTASRPNISGKTKEESTDVQTETIPIAAVPLPDGRVKSKTGDDTSDTTYKNWYNEVYLSPTTEDSSGSTGDGE